MPLGFQRTDFAADKALRWLRVGVEDICDLQGNIPFSCLSNSTAQAHGPRYNCALSQLGGISEAKPKCFQEFPVQWEATV